jgi:hypothetical protein
MRQSLNVGDPPVELLGVVVDDAGGIGRRAPTLPLTFSFHWRGVKFQGEISNAGEQLALSVLANVAVVPFSAEDLTRRERLLALLQADAAAHAGAKLALSSDNRLTLNRELALPKGTKLTSDRLVSETAAAVLVSAPYLDLIAQEGLADPPRRA